MTTSIRYGITGCGYIGAEQARIVERMSNAELVAVHSGSGAGAERVAHELGCEVSRTLNDLITREDIDALIVASPNNLHRDPVVTAAKNNKHVFCEKPFALSLDDCDDMVAACRQAKVTLMVGHMMHFYSGIMRIKDWIDSGVIGEPLVAHVERTGWESSQTEVSWKKMQTKSGGHLFHHIHEIDLLLWLIGPIREVFAIGGNLAHGGPSYGDEDDVLLLTLKFQGKALGSMQYGSGFQWGEHLLKINGTKGAVSLNNKESRIDILQEGKGIERFPLFDNAESQASMLELFQRTHGGSTYGKPTDRPPQYLYGAMVDELEYFNEVLLGKSIDESRKMLFDGSAARASVEVASAALLSRGAGRPVMLPLASHPID